MNDWDRFSVTMRLSAEEHEMRRRARDAKKEATHQRTGRIDLIVALVLVAVLGAPILFMVLR